MPFIKSNLLKSKEFKLFLAVWIVYMFYLQMFGSSSMANTQSALTAAIVNEGRFEIDTYYRSGGSGNSFYNGHYYSGQAPGISFLSVPLYAASKPIFYLLPQSAIDYLFEKLESYGSTLPVDFYGNKKIISDYFPDLNKKQILEYIFISGFILPVFTTSLFSALGALLVYLLLKRFTSDESLRISATLFYAFGTLVFPLSTEFFERPIATTLIFAAFIILLKVRRKELKPKGTVLFASGLLAGFSAWFDYFHLFLAGLLFLYLLSFLIKDKSIKSKGFKKLAINLNKPRLFLLLSFVIGMLLPIFLLLLYQYAIFDDPFTTSYTHRAFEQSVYGLSGIYNIQMPDMATLFQMLGFILYSPIIALALYGVYRACLKRDTNYHDVLAAGILIAFTFVYSTILVFSYSSYPLMPESFKRYMTPILPFTFIFLPYIFANNRISKEVIIKILFFSFGAISIFLNWTSAQYGGHWGLSHFDINENKLTIIPEFFENGPSSSFLSTLAGVVGINQLLVNLIGLIILVLLVYLIWKH